MSSTLLELTRAAHEDVERLERLIVKVLQNELATYKERLRQNHRVRYMIGQIIPITHKLVRFLVSFTSVGCDVEIYEDKDDARKDETATLGLQTATGTNVFSAFYDRLKEIREYYMRHPSAWVIDTTDEYEELLEVKPHIEFGAEVSHSTSLLKRTREHIVTVGLLC
ncbi:hypothetical protein L1987_42656 [Smallanthus sonchifolius]|uniref:Uncharacterized protein n=1 Tax=Smallanthus sonchifolius TaxID=185202 RepID=A0ACB9GJJ9_9ASTR|nr:hypothetical protein L1987_42656 [Smallanthus sonchifolius]